MTYAIFAIIANQVSSSGCSAYTYSIYSHQPYVRPPWFQFSEQLVDAFSATGFHPAYPFLTGHGGANQVVLFGYLGLRLIPTSWSLHINPALPPQIPQVRYRTFFWHGWPISAFSNQTHTTLTRDSTLEGTPGTVPNSTYATSPIPVVVGAVGSDNTTTYDLPPNGFVTVPNRMYALIKTTPGNVLQCQPADSAGSFVPGQYPLAAVDGATSTTWQPEFANETASVTVEIPEADRGRPVTGIRLEWAQRPPYNYSVSFSNESSDAGQVVVQAEVDISDPWDEQTLLGVVAPYGNTTYYNVTAEQGDAAVVTSRYATLTIWGSLYDANATAQNMSGDGASVAEWEVIVQGADGEEAAAQVGPVRRGLLGDAERALLGKVGRYNREWARKRRGFDTTLWL